MKSNKVKTPWYAFYDGVKPHLEYPDISIYNMLENSMKNRKDYISYNYYGTKKTYKEFITQIDKCARALKCLGVKESESVSICMPNTPEAIIAFYAINKIGAVANMIHPLSAENEIKYFLNISKSKYIVAIDMAFNKINHIAKDTNLKKCIVVSVKNAMPFHLKVGYQLTKGRKIKLEKSDLILSWNEFIKMSEKYDKKIESNFKGNDVAVILYSGGTTGYPKGIELTNLNFNALAMQSYEACQCLKEKDRGLAIMPVFHGFGLGICIHTVQYFGGTSILLPQFSSKTFDRLLKKYKPNIIAGVPTLYEALLKNKKLDGYDLSFVKCAISGGDSLSISLKKKVDTFFKEHGANIQIREGYGLTECVTGSCLTPMKYYREGSIGIPYPDTYYKIIKPNTEEEMLFGEEGEILISGPSVMKGYLDDEEENKLTLRKHKDGLTWLYTGDLGYMDKDGFIYFKQRLKRLIISSGYCLYPQYIENIIDSHPKVLMSCVIGIDHPYKVQVAKAFIVLRNGFTATDELLKEIKEYCEKNLARYSWPAQYEFRSELPKTLVGKIAYSKLEEEEREKNEKNKLTVLLIHPEISRTKYNFVGIIENECLELEYISALLKEQGHNVEIYDGQVEKKTVATKIKECNPDIVYVCGRTRQENFMLEYCNEAKKYNQEIITIIGGLHAQLCYGRMYKDFVDYILTSFDIYKILDIIDYHFGDKEVNLDSIESICYKKGNSWVKNKQCTFDINKLPLPDRTYFYEHPKNYRYLELEHSAWVRTAYCCPYRCKFCHRNKMNMGQYVCRNIKDVVEEIENIKSDNIYIVDDDFLFNKDRLYEFIKLIREKNIKKKYICYGRSDFIAKNEELMSELKDIGLYYVLVGLEAINDNQLLEYNKNSNVTNNVKSIEICNKLGINIMGMFIVDLDYKPKDFKILYKWIKNHNLKHIAISIFTPEMGIETYEMYKERLITDNPSHWDYLHLVAKPTNMSVKRYYFNYYILLIKLFLKAKKEGVYDFIDYGDYIMSFIKNIFKTKRSNDDE